jgi:ankyrin repeat protein
MDSILCGSKPEILNFLEHPRPCNRKKNDFGQTATHVAVLRPDILSMLLQTHDVADIDGADFYGNSPLDYAAAYGYTDSVLQLLKAGADPLKDGHLKFLHWALFWDRWDVAKEVLAFFRATARFSKTFLKSELHHLMKMVPGHSDNSMSQWWLSAYWGRSPEFLERMLSLGVDKHMLFEDGNTLLHYSEDSKWIDSLFNAGFQKIDHRNDGGETALMVLIPGRSDLVKHILTRGCSVNYQNSRGETALQMIFSGGDFHWLSGFGRTTDDLNSYYLKSISNDLAIIASLLHHGADTSIHDKCRCPCAPNGCHPLRRLYRNRGQSIAYIWIMECLLILIDIQGQAIAQKAIFEIKRLHEFELADMSHVCCNRESAFPHKPMDDAEVDEIIDEEKEFVALLEEKMNDPATSPDNISIEESWLSLIFDFRTPEKPFKREKYWTRSDPYSKWSFEKVPLTSDTLISLNTTSVLHTTRAEEEKDQYWTLIEASDGDEVAPSSIYLAWVEWVYKNPDKYDYPSPVDRNWYERRKYWATRQAEVLEGLS